MRNNIKATLLRYHEMSWSALTQLKQWMKHSASFNGFDVQSFADPSLRVASATNAQGETVCYAPVETVLMVSTYAVNPKATPSEAQRAGDELDTRIASEAQKNGISKLLIVVPKDQPGLPEGEWREVRVYERRIPQAVAMQGISCSDSTSSVKFLN